MRFLTRNKLQLPWYKFLERVIVEWKMPSDSGTAPKNHSLKDFETEQTSYTNCW